ncbi:MAG: membrane protein [Nitrospinaceae bacterium]|nr:MAG: membrane protein [Nitrospinaceae bacterium]
MNRRVKTGIILFIAVAGIFITFTFPPVPQDQDYFHFADNRSLWGIPNFGDVMSNIPFLLVGAPGLLALGKYCKDSSRFIHPLEALPFFVAFVGLILLAPCSAYFHWAPSNETLVWDRLPMTLVFMAFFSTIITERIHLKFGLIFLPILLAVGIGSVIYWSVTESQGHGDLRPYALVQFLPVLIIPAILILFAPRYTEGRHLVAVIIGYGLAKVCELLDGQIYALTHHLMSGHTLKHLIAAIAVFGLVKYIRVRRKV